MKKRKQRHKIGILRLLNFKNLQTEIHGYGFDYSFSRYATNLFLYIFVLFCFGIAYRMKVIHIFIACTVFALLLPKVFLKQFEYMYEQKRFDDVVRYLQQLMNCYSREPHTIRVALRECCRSFGEDTQMCQCIQEAVQIIEHDADTTNLYEKAFKKIEKKYRCDLMLKVHSSLIQMEAIGGDYKKIITLLQDEVISWQRRVYRYQKNLKYQNTISSAMILICMALAFVVTIMFQMLKEYMDVFKMPFYSIVQCFFLSLYAVIYVKFQTAERKSWLTVSKRGDKKTITKDFDILRRMDLKIEKRNRAIKTICGILFVVVGIFLENMQITVAAVFFTYLMLTTIGRKKRNARKRLQRQLELHFSSWLSNVILLLQKNTLYLSLQESLKDCPYVLEEDLKNLIKHMKTDLSTTPFLEFLQDIATPEIQNAMTNLYSMIENDGQQLVSLLESNRQNQELLDQQRDENRIAIKGGNIAMPLLIAIMQVGIMFAISITGFMQNVVNIMGR